MLDLIQQVDQSITIAINQANSPFADTLMELVSGRLTWAPLYAALLYLFQKIYGWKRTLFILIAIGINVVFTDQVSVMMKFGFERLRPCHEPGIKDLLHLPYGCGGQFGFVSSHAANTMGLGLLVALILKNRWMTVGMMGFALFNGYSRIYLGKHYFFDVVGGFLLGAIGAFLCYWLLKQAIKRFKL